MLLRRGLGGEGERGCCFTFYWFLMIEIFYLPVWEDLLFSKVWCHEREDLLGSIIITVWCSYTEIGLWYSIYKLLEIIFVHIIGIGMDDLTNCITSNCYKEVVWNTSHNFGIRFSLIVYTFMNLICLSNENFKANSTSTTPKL